MTIKNLSEFIKLFEELLRHRGIINNDNSLKDINIIDMAGFIHKYITATLKFDSF